MDVELVQSGEGKQYGFAKTYMMKWLWQDVKEF
jgi:hypothetical protein